MKIKSYTDFVTIDFLQYKLLISWGYIKLIKLIDKRKYNSFFFSGNMINLNK